MLKIAVWKTGHDISDTIAEYLVRLPNSSLLDTSKLNDRLIESYDIHIGYGILRGMDNVFKSCERLKKPWFNVDRGYFGPNHYSGYYRVSLRGTQLTNVSFKDAEEIGKLSNNKPYLLDWRGIDTSKKMLVCWPTGYASAFFDVKLNEWPKYINDCAKEAGFSDVIIRHKGTEKPLEEDLLESGIVLTLNSAVGWEAMRQGIPVISDNKISTIGYFCSGVGIKELSDFQRDNRELIFKCMCGSQMKLNEMRTKLWPLMEKLISI
jgi:hypothetical protein